MDKATFLVMVMIMACFYFIHGNAGYSRFRVPILPYIGIFSAFGIRQIADRMRFGK